jgi:hypothetical protein
VNVDEVYLHVKRNHIIFKDVVRKQQEFDQVGLQRKLINNRKKLNNARMQSAKSGKKARRGRGVNMTQGYDTNFINDEEKIINLVEKEMSIYHEKGRAHGEF